MMAGMCGCCSGSARLLRGCGPGISRLCAAGARLAPAFKWLISRLLIVLEGVFYILGDPGLNREIPGIRESGKEQMNGKWDEMGNVGNQGLTHVESGMGVGIRDGGWRVWDGFASKEERRQSARSPERKAMFGGLFVHRHGFYVVVRGRLAV
jgi:hypothetical protein